MTGDARILAFALPAILLGAPLAFGLAARLRSSERLRRHESGRLRWRLIAVSALLYALAFNLIFFLQELFLVLPKALTPGLRPTLFHNNHDWSGHNPLERLEQGSGALACVVAGLGLLGWLAVHPPRDATLRLFVIWLTFHAFLGSVPQVIVGAILPGNDVGMAMEYLHFSQTAKVAAALVAMFVIATVCLWLTPRWLDFVGSVDRSQARGSRDRFILQAVTAPAAIGVLLILPFRYPGAIDQVVLVPVAVAVIGVVWVQASAVLAKWLSNTVVGRLKIGWPLAALALQLLAFQILLRPGVRFY